MFPLRSNTSEAEELNNIKKKINKQNIKKYSKPVESELLQPPIDKKIEINTETDNIFTKIIENFSICNELMTNVNDVIYPSTWKQGKGDEETTHAITPKKIEEQEKIIQEKTQQESSALLKTVKDGIEKEMDKVINYIEKLSTESDELIIELKKYANLHDSIENDYKYLVNELTKLEEQKSKLKATLEASPTLKKSYDDKIKRLEDEILSFKDELKYNESSVNMLSEKRKENKINLDKSKKEFDSLKNRYEKMTELEDKQKKLTIKEKDKLIKMIKQMEEEKQPTTSSKTKILTSETYVLTFNKNLNKLLTVTNDNNILIENNYNNIYNIGLITMRELYAIFNKFKENYDIFSKSLLSPNGQLKLGKFYANQLKLNEASNKIININNNINKIFNLMVDFEQIYNNYMQNYNEPVVKGFGYSFIDSHYVDNYHNISRRHL